jgi:hypothetical protein
MEILGAAVRAHDSVTSIEAVWITRQPVEVRIMANGEFYAKTGGDSPELEYYYRDGHVFARLDGDWFREEHLDRGLPNSLLPEAVLNEALWPSYELRGVEDCGPRRCYLLVRVVGADSQAGSTEFKVWIEVESHLIRERREVVRLNIQGRSVEQTLGNVRYERYNEPLELPPDLP